ncbi:DUF6076 domain-containing protein [Ruminococcus bovis]|uniref:Uncharacterized protein n=1 Tax=Ruminococcus bovis TaxID=2564099 RepID=A0A4P8XTU4_9FIRM|nr:DUF6076 domain-containing protein [Ruminococcus bovis]QCT06411.1 hypothetical protein E5Z56_03165 [Ruminococcus bovis]
MFDIISFFVGDKSIEINGTAFPLGELTTQTLNITKPEFSEMYHLAESAFETIYKNKTPPSKEEWNDCNNKFIKLERMMFRYRLLALIKDNRQVLYETQSYVSQLSILDDNEKYEMCESEEALRKMTLEYSEYVDEWAENSFQRDTDDTEVKDIPRELLIFPGDVQEKWDFYCNYCSKYLHVLYDIAWFGNTIHNFIDHYLSALKKLNSDNYAAALYDFLYGEMADKLVANPVQGSGLYSRTDPILIEYIPRETIKCSGKYKIYTSYQVKRLQTLLKTDFYCALEAGYIIRKCEYCGRCFLLKKAYHTKYCDNPAPDNPKYTCAQLGYRKRGIKETVPDNPKAQSLKRCLTRIEKDCSRNAITAEEKELLSNTARDMYYRATRASGITNEEFETSLASENLYSKCGVKRKTKRRGRPKSTD